MPSDNSTLQSLKLRVKATVPCLATVYPAPLISPNPVLLAVLVTNPAMEEILMIRPPLPP